MEEFQLDPGRDHVAEIIQQNYSDASAGVQCLCALHFAAVYLPYW